MEDHEQRITLEFPVSRTVDLFILISLISLLSIPLGLTNEPQNAMASKSRTQPAVLVTAAAEKEKAMTQSLEVYAATDSVNFLMESSPLTGRTATETVAPSVGVPGPSAASHTEPTRVTLQVLQGTVLEESEEVAMLVSEQCSQSGASAGGTNSCERGYSNGHHATVITQNANEGDELKNQTVVEEFDEDNTLLYRKTIRHRVDYNYLNDQKAREKELFDITYQPAGKKITRELMVYEYFLDSGKEKSLSWTQYKQIENGTKAALVFHALLRYDHNGSPDRGIAERWDQGKKAETFMNWRHSKGLALLDQETWKEWEGWIRNVSLQAYLP